MVSKLQFPVSTFGLNLTTLLLRCNRHVVLSRLHLDIVWYRLFFKFYHSWLYDKIF